MNKKDLIEALALKAGHTKVESGQFVDALFDIISEALTKGESVQLIGFGTFGFTETKARIGSNPKTGRSIEIAASKRPKFTASAKLKAAVKNH